MNKLTFPQDFLWGSATAAHQIEGNNANSDWWQWEHSEKRAAELRNQNKNPKDYYSGVGCDSYQRYEEDFDLIKKLNQNAHRFSIEWARIEPRQGQFDRAEIEHYRKVLIALRSRGIKPFVTLHHFTNPQWFAEKGGWQKPENVEYFLNYCKLVIGELGEFMQLICIINEPNVYAGLAYIAGKFPPQRIDLFQYFAVKANLIRAHVLAYRMLKNINLHLQLGSAVNATTTRIFGLSLVNPLTDHLAYRSYFQELAENSDYLGLNYYHRNFIPAPRDAKYSDVGWRFYPQGLFDTLLWLKRFNKPVYITENGIADAEDLLRREYIQKHLIEVHRAISSGVDVRGYLHWSLIDNFEWAEGFGPRFGLVEIDRQHGLQRKVRPSALYYAEICAANAVGEDRP